MCYLVCSALLKEPSLCHVKAVKMDACLSCSAGNAKVCYPLSIISSLSQRPSDYSWQCSKDLPQCEKFTRCGLECRYPSVSNSGHSSSISKTLNEPHARRILAILVSPDVEVNKLSPEDLDLFVRWCTETYQSIAQSQDNGEIWRNVITQEALNSSVLLNSILACSALHIAYHSGQDSVQYTELQDAAQARWIKTCTEIGNEVNSLNGLDSTALLRLRNIHMALSFAFPSFVKSSISTSTLDDLCSTFQQMRRSTQVLTDLADNIQQPEEVSPEASQQETSPRMPNTTIFVIRELRNLNTHQEDVYSEAIDQLDLCLQYTTQGSDPGIAGLLWIFKFPSEYLTLLEKRDPLALIVLAHYCVVLYHLRERWWMSDWGVHGLHEICELLGSDGLRTISWAIDAIGVVL